MSPKMWSMRAVLNELERRMALRPRDHRIAEHADLLDLRLDHVAGLEVPGRGVLTEARDAGDGAERQHVAGAEAERRVVRQHLRDGRRHVVHVRHLARLAVDAQLHVQVVRVADLVRRDDPRAERAERVDRLAEREDAAPHLLALDVARRDVVEDEIPGDVVHCLLGAEPLRVAADDHRELELVVQLFRQMLRIDDRVVGADDRVDVLEEDDPRRDLVRPVDALRLLLVLAEVAGRVEELLRHDRRSQPRIRERRPLARVVRAAALEVLAHGGNVEADDLLALDPPDLAVVVRDQPHLLCNHLSTSPAFSSGGNTG
jgi:hypothetical protein